jgi:antitoxin component YwqK of YwqJK toxin-antitoxin module
MMAQEPCSYSPSSKKGGFWVFATFYLPNTQIPLEGECEQKQGNKPFLYRMFKAGRIQKEIVYSSQNVLTSYLEIYKKKRDSVLGEYKNFGENGKLMLHEIFYLDKNNRRCVHRKSYYHDEKLRFDQYFSWIKDSEITEYQRANHPPHTIDEDGYTYVQVPFGYEKIYDMTGQIAEERYHQLRNDGTHEFASLEGTSIRYHHNGKIKEKMHYKSGKLHGTFLELNFLGDTICVGSYEMGIKKDLWTYWHDNKKLKATHFYNINGKYPFQAQKEEWTDKGMRILQFQFDENGIGKLKEWTEKGVLIHEQDLISLKLDNGKETFWYPNGQIKSYMNHTKGADTTYQEWYESGREKTLKRSYSKNGILVTSNKEWYSNGNLKELVELERKEFVNTYTQQKYYENGNLSFVDIRKNREQFIEAYASNGIKIRAIKLLDGKINGRFQELDSTGQVIVDINYLNGLRHGAYKVYKNNIISYEALFENGVWIQKPEKKSSFFDKFSTLNATEKHNFISTAYTNLNRLLYAPNPLRKSKSEIDTLATIIWQMKRLAPNFTNWIINTNVNNPVLNIRLVESYFRDLKTNQITSSFSKELLAGLDQLNLKLPDFNFEYGEKYINIELKDWVNMAMLKQIFPKINHLMHIYQPSEKSEPTLDIRLKNSKYDNHLRYSMERRTINSWKITIQHSMNNYHMMLYGDGTIEIENQAMSWGDFLKVDFDVYDFGGRMYDD